MRLCFMAFSISRLLLHVQLLTLLRSQVMYCQSAEVASLSAGCAMPSASAAIPACSAVNGSRGFPATACPSIAKSQHGFVLVLHSIITARPQAGILSMQQ